MVRAGIFAVVLAFWSGAGVADSCLGAADLAQGITVNTANGAVYHYRAQGQTVLATVPWKTSKGAPVSNLTFNGGVYIVQEVMTYPQDTSGATDVVGGMSGAVATTKVTYLTSRPTAEAGKSWTGTVKTWDETAATGILQTPTTSQFQAVYQFLAETEVTWGGCRYRIIPVEMQLVITERSVLHFDGVDQAPLAADIGQVHEKRRLLYFPDLGFAVVTKIEPTARSSYSFANGLTGIARTGG